MNKNRKISIKMKKIWREAKRLQMERGHSFVRSEDFGDAAKLVASVRYKEKVFNLDSDEEFRRAERFKAQLENAGYNVTTEPLGFNKVKIKGN